MAGYLSLFFDDARQALPQLTLAQVKQDIYDNYTAMFRPPNLQEQEDIKVIAQNTILSQIEQQLQVGIEEGQARGTGIAYWDINMGAAMAHISQGTSEVEKVSKAIEYIGRIQTEISNAIERGQGIVSSDIIAQLESNKKSLQELAATFGEKVATNGLDSALYGSLRGAVSRAQGAIHETAVAVAGAIAGQYVNQEFEKANQAYRVIVEQTGGTLREDSQIKAAADRFKLNLGSANNAKNDITIVILNNGTGQIIWHSGLSLKSTTSANPKLVHIMSFSITTLLNKIYSTETYLNLAGALGEGDWAGTSVGIGKLAKQKNVTTSGAILANTWKDIIYDAIYSQLIDMFSGMGHAGILNNAQYLLINATPISMYSIFERLKTLAGSKKITGDYSIPGIKIEGIKNAINRSALARQNVQAFVRLKSGITPSEARIERSTEAWKNIYSSLEATKIHISLKYAELGLGLTR